MQWSTAIDVNSPDPQTLRGGEAMPRAEHSANANMPLGLPQGSGTNLKSYTPTQLFFLMRLSFLQRQRRETVNLLDPSDWRMRLVNKALYSTYRDCVEQGVGDEAKLLMAQQAERS
jgi:hypothetical protein